MGSLTNGSISPFSTRSDIGKVLVGVSVFETVAEVRYYNGRAIHVVSCLKHIFPFHPDFHSVTSHHVSLDNWEHH